MGKYEFEKLNPYYMADMDVFFDYEKRKVLIIKDEFRYNFVVWNEENQKNMLYSDGARDEEDAVAFEIELNRLLFIPNINKIAGSERIGENMSKDKRAELFSSRIFFIISYGVLEDENFKGCSFENAIIDVIVKNIRGEVYKVSFICDAEVKSCDGNPKGHIDGEVYSFEPYAKLIGDVLIEY